MPFACAAGMKLKIAAKIDRVVSNVADASDRIKVYSVLPGPGGTNRREYIAAIKKRDFAVPPELKESLTSEDALELDETIEIYRHAEQLQQQTVALNLPATLRSAIDYVRTSASDSEIKLILQVVEEARRELRKYENAGRTNHAAIEATQPAPAKTKTDAAV